MVTVRKLEANRRNAQHSTGPRTPEGKAAVSQNSVTHGLRARHTPVIIEKPFEFRQLCADYFVEWQPKSHTECVLVEQMAVTQWKLGRLECVENNAWMQSTQVHAALKNVVYKTEKGTLRLPDMVGKREAEAGRALDRHSRHICRLERSYFRALETLQRLQDRRERKEGQFQRAAPAPVETEVAVAAAAGSAPATSKSAKPIFANRKRFGGWPLHQPSGLPDGI